MVVDMSERESGACGTGFAGVPIEQFDNFVLGSGGWLLGIRVIGIKPHAIITANFVAVFEVFDSVHPLGSEYEGKGFVGDKNTGGQLVNMVVG